MYQFRADDFSMGCGCTTVKRPQLTQADRKKLALDALSGKCVTHLAKAYGVSRKFVYQQKNIALGAIDHAFSPAVKTQQDKEIFQIKFTKGILEQLILAIVLCGRSSYRSVQRIIEDVFDYQISLGKITSIVGQASQKAAQINSSRDLSKIQIACHDEYFHHGVPFFVAVEPYSRYCFLLTKGISCSTEGWVEALTPLVNRGYAPAYVVADGGKPLRSGLKTVLPNIPCYYDVFHLCREFGRSILKFSQYERRYRTELQKAELRIRQYDLKRETCDDGTFENLDFLKCSIDFAVDAIDRLRKGIGRTIHKALSPFKNYTFAEREAFYDKTIDSILEILKSRLTLRFKADDIYSALCVQKANLLGLFKRSDEIGTIRASSMVENFNFNLRQQLQGQAFIDQKHLNLQMFYLNHRRFLAGRCQRRKFSSPAELLDQKKHPHWLELIGYERYQSSVT